MPEPNIPSRLEVNAAIEALIASPESGDWTSRAATIIAFGKHIPKMGQSLEYRKTKWTDGGSLTGYTSEAGDITIKPNEEKQERTFSLGIHRERVGHFKLSRHTLFGFEAIEIQGFWKSDPTTVSYLEDEPPIYDLVYDQQFQPKYFGIEETRHIFAFRIFSREIAIIKTILCEMVPDKVEKRICYGIEIGDIQ